MHGSILSLYYPHPFTVFPPPHPPWHILYHRQIGISSISKIKLVGYHQWRILIGWATSTRHWDFPQISEEQESWRTGRRKIVQTQRWSDQAQKVGRCCSAALKASGPNWTVKPLVFLISHWRFILLALVFVKFVWRKAVAIAVAFRCCGLYIERAVKNKTTNGGYRLVWKSLNCWMIVQLICFPTSYGTIYVCFHSWFRRICFDRATARLFVSATHHGASIFVN